MGWHLSQMENTIHKCSKNNILLMEHNLRNFISTGQDAYVSFTELENEFIQ